MKTKSISISEAVKLWWQKLHCAPGVMQFGVWIVDRKKFRVKPVHTIRPNLIIIGSQKSGTTSLHNYLADHPDIHMSNPWKEPRYFVFYEWAQSYFRENKGIIVKNKTDLIKRYMLQGYRFQRYFGESVPDYTYHHRAFELKIPQKIEATSADARLIFILRNPIERIVSSYFHSKKFGAETRSISECLKSSDSYLSTSLYSYQLKEYLEVFPLSSIKIVFFEELVSEPEQTMDNIFDFLEIDRLRNMKYGVHNKTSPLDKKILTARDYEEIIGPISEDIESLETLLGRTVPGWDISRERWVDELKDLRQQEVKS